MQSSVDTTLKLFSARRRLIFLLFCFLVSVSINGNATNHKGKIVKFDVAEGTADLSLVSFAQQANMTLLFPISLVKDITTNSVSGWSSIEDGINELLGGTQLLAEFNDSGYITIAVKQPVERKDMPNLKKTKIAAAMLATLSTLALSQESSESPTIASADKDEPQVTEVITIQGVRGSIIESINDKRFSAVIKDSISAEDIGQLPDENIAEALQRVTGIQMSRAADGEGTSIQIRGISDNNVELNGQSVAGSAANRNINFQDIPSELFSGIEVFKAPTSDKIEGSLGGTINLKTRKPLNIRNDQVGSVTVRAKYSEASGETSPDLNGFFAKNFRDNAWGDFGFLVNIASKEVITQTDVFGGGDFSNAPAIWFSRAGGQNPAGNNGNNQFLASGPFQYLTGQDAEGSQTFGVDVNGDGVVDGSDRYFTPGGFTFFSRLIQSDRSSINTAFQWAPNDDLNLHLEYSRSDIEEELNGSQFSYALNAARSFLINGQDPTFSPIGNNAFIADSGLIGATSIRMGGAPSERLISRESDNLRIGADYQLNDYAFLEFAYNRSTGASATNQAQLNMGYDWDRNNAINAVDWAGIVQYDLTLGTFPNVNFFESPRHPAEMTDSPTSYAELVELDPTNLAYNRLSYFQMQRNASDTENDKTAFNLDFLYEFDDSPVTSIKVGVRQAEQSYSQRSYINTNQRNAALGPNDEARLINVQNIKVAPDANTDPDRALIASDLASCFGTGSIDTQGSNLPSEWSSTLCGNDFFTDYFNMLDIRAINPESGVGYYETTGSRYTVEEETKAIYVMGEFEFEVAGLPVFGNAGLRYVETQTSSTGYLRDPIVPNTPASFSLISLPGEYSDTLPSMNLNLGINNETLLRFAAYEALGRPGLGALSPRIQLNFNDELEGFAGTANLGNPDLDPIRSVNYDLSYEWYYKEDSMLSAAIFVKDLASVIFTNAADTSEVEIAGDLFIATQPQNQEGTTISGYELNLQHAFSHLDGLLSNTGIGVNYTYTDEDTDNLDQEGDPIGRARLSQDSYNVVAYYDDKRFSLRLAYNWRDDFVRRTSVALGFNRPEALPEIEKARGQLDLTANYSFSSKLKVNLSVVNLNDSTTERYIKYEELVNYVSSAGRRFNLGVVYRF